MQFEHNRFQPYNAIQLQNFESKFPKKEIASSSTFCLTGDRETHLSIIPIQKYRTCEYSAGYYNLQST